VIVIRALMCIHTFLYLQPMAPDDAVANVPAAQVVQLVRPYPDAYVPLPHGTHVVDEVAPVTELEVPGLQVVHTLAAPVE
jgi:hypothetical protein